MGIARARGAPPFVEVEQAVALYRTLGPRPPSDLGIRHRGFAVTAHQALGPSDLAPSYPAPSSHLAPRTVAPRTIAPPTVRAAGTSLADEVAMAPRTVSAVAAIAVALLISRMRRSCREHSHRRAGNPTDVADAGAALGRPGRHTARSVLGHRRSALAPPAVDAVRRGGARRQRLQRELRRQRVPTACEWSAKIGPEAQTEVVVSRILWGLGYHQPPIYYLPSWTLDRAATDAARERSALPSEAADARRRVNCGSGPTTRFSARASFAACSSCC